MQKIIYHEHTNKLLIQALHSEDKKPFWEGKK